MPPKEIEIYQKKYKKWEGNAEIVDQENWEELLGNFYAENRIIHYDKK